MDYETIKLDRDGALLTVRLSRPEKRNAINRQMHADLQDLCHRLRDDTDTRVVIFAGEGDIFSAAADTSEWGDPGSPNELEVRHVSGVGSRTSGDIENLGQVTIAAVRGCAIGGGLVFAAYCDLRVAGEGTWFLDPGGRAGPALGWNALPRLAREMGHSRALELTVTCERFDAKRAYEYGLVTHLEPDDAVKAKARALADAIIANPALPVALTKATMRALKRGSEMGDAAYSDQDMLLYTRLMSQRKARLEKEGRG